MVKTKSDKRPRGALGREIVKNRSTYLMMVPAVVFLFIFAYIPIAGIIMAFEDFNPIKGWFGSEFIGFENFRYVFKDMKFWNSVKNTVIISFFRILFQFPAPIIIALMLNECRFTRYKKIVQTLFTFPNFLSWIIAGGILKNFLRSDGFVNSLLSTFGIGPVSFLTNPGTFRILLYITEIWKSAGWSAIIYLAAISSIDMQQYDAATVDGASRFQKMRFITVPSIKGTMSFMLILALAGIMNAGFDQIFNMWNDVVKDSAQIIDTYIYEITFQRVPDYGFSTAIGLFKSVINFAMILGADRVMRKLSGSGIYY